MNSIILGNESENSVPGNTWKRCPTLLPKAEFIGITFEKVLTLFGKCHSMYDSAKKYSPGAISEFGKLK